jgi:hypothetical protein
MTLTAFGHLTMRQCEFQWADATQWHFVQCSRRGFSSSGTKTLSERIFLCESFSVHAEVTHKSKNGFMNSAFNRLYREK